MAVDGGAIYGTIVAKWRLCIFVHRLPTTECTKESSNPISLGNEKNSKVALVVLFGVVNSDVGQW